MRLFSRCVSAGVLSLGVVWFGYAQGQTPKDKEAPAKEKYMERFDFQVREHIFRGFNGDEAEMKKGLDKCEEALKKDPKNAEAMVWRGAARVFQAGTLMNKGNFGEGMKLWTSGIKDMDDAKVLQPDSVSILIPRAAVFMPAGRNSPPAMGKPLLQKALADFEQIYKAQEKMLDKMGEHPLGELRMGLADAYRLLNQPEKSKAQLEAIVKELPKTKYAERAETWLKAPADAKLAHSCIGCHKPKN